jgi:O-antigen/teichoic acid export membrane protein
MRRPGDKLMVLMIVSGGVLTQFLTLVSGVIAARMLGVEGRGQVVLVAVLAQIASQLTVGGSLPNAITKELASHGLRARDGLRGLLGHWVVWGGLGAVGAAAYFLATEGRDLAPEAVGLAVGVAIMALSGMTARILVGAMLGEGADPLKIAMTGVLPQLFATVVLGVALALGAAWSPVEIVVVMIGCQALVLAARLRGLAPATNRPEDRLDRQELARIARSTHISSIGPLDGLSLDRALVGSMVGSAALGLYSAAVALGSLAAMLGASVAMVALPRLSAAQRGAREDERALVRRWLVMSVLMLVPTVVVFELANPFAFPLLFGEEFRGAIPCGYWYVAASGLLAFRRVLIAVLQARGRGSTASWIELALTPLVVVAVLAASIADDVEIAGMGMLGTAFCAVVALSLAVRLVEPAPVTARSRAPQDAGPEILETPAEELAAPGPDPAASGR